MKRKRRLRHWSDLPRQEQLRLAARMIGHSRELQSAIFLSCGVYPKDALINQDFRSLSGSMTRLTTRRRELSTGTPASRLLNNRLEYIGDPEAIFVPGLDPIDVDLGKHIYSREAMKIGRQLQCGHRILAASELLSGSEAISLYCVSYRAKRSCKIGYVAQWRDVTKGYYVSVLRRDVSTALREARENYTASAARRLGVAA